MPDTDKLTAFVDWAQKHITGDEKGQAQIFLDHLFLAFDQPGCLDVGGTPECRIRKAKEDGGGTAFADYVWKPICLIEMKKRGTDLQKVYRQAFDYWSRLVPNRPRYVVLCNFDEFRVYDFDTDLDMPKDTVLLTDIPQRWGPLAFLTPGFPTPTFGADRLAVTRQAADSLAACFNKLTKRGIEPALAQRFILQILVAFFSEDIGLMEKYFVAQILEDCKTPADTYDLIGGLFDAMNTPLSRRAGGRFKAIQYFNGGLFAQPARIELRDTELVILRETTKFDWSKVQPEVFGTLFQHSMGLEERHAFGAHFTSPNDIMKIVGPTIVEPWREQIESAKTLKRLNELRDRLHRFRVLDPACGSGNFLYIAYRELKRIEARIIDRINNEFPSRAEPMQRQLSFLTAQNFYGLDIIPFAVEVAKVTMMIARKLSIDELHISEAPLPLDNLDNNFIACDSLIDAEGNATKWPSADVIIGNPPFLDARKMTMEHGRPYVAKLEDKYPEIPRRADLCTYWFRKAHDHLPPCTPDDPVSGRAGLIGTQNIRNNEAREGGLDHIVGSGTIIEAVTTHPWSGEANVYVSVVNWIKTQDPVMLPKIRRLWFTVPPTVSLQKATRQKSGNRAKCFELDFRECTFINSALSDATDVSEAKVLRCNRQPKTVFEGIQTGHDGFVIDATEARQLLVMNDQHKHFVKPFINGSDLLSGKYQTAQEFVVDLSNLDMIKVSALPALLAIPKNRVLADWQKDAATERQDIGQDRGEHQNRLDAWWSLKRPRQDLQEALTAIPRYIACSAVMKRPTFVFIASNYLPTNALKVFIFPDDYSFGILQSYVHWLWFTTKCSKLGNTFRYTPDTVFDTFPWPQAPTAKQIEAVALAGRHINNIRTEALKTLKGGLRALYRTLELPGKNPLKDAHEILDAAVMEAYGFSTKGDLLAQILKLNLEVADKEAKGLKVTAPGIPVGYPTPADLISNDCIQPMA